MAEQLREQALRDEMDKNPSAGAALVLGDCLQARGQDAEAIVWWEKAVKLDRGLAGSWRRLGRAYFNVQQDAMAAKGAYHRALQNAKAEERAEILAERDRLWALTGEEPGKRVEELEKYPELVRSRDDLTVSYGALLNQLGEHEAALVVLTERKFAGVGALEQFVRTHVALGRQALWRGDAEAARRHLAAALDPPVEVGEFWEAGADRAEIHYWMGQVLQKLGDVAGAQASWERAAGELGKVSEASYYAVLALRAMGRFSEAEKLGEAMLARGLAMGNEPIHATTQGGVFAEDLRKRQVVRGMMLEMLGRAALHELKAARRLLEDILLREPCHGLAADFKTAIDWET